MQPLRVVLGIAGVAMTAGLAYGIYSVVSTPVKSSKPKIQEIAVLRQAPPPPPPKPEEKPPEPEVKEEVKLPEPEPLVEITSVDMENWSARLDATLGQLNAQLKDDAQVAHLTGLINLRLKRSQLAEPALRRAVQLAPNDQEMRSDLAEQLMQLGRDDEALNVLQSLPGSELMSAKYASQLADCQLRLGLLDEANQVLASALQKDPRSSTLWLLLGKTQLQLESYADSEASVRQALANDQSNVEAWLALGQALNLQQRKEEAKSAAAKAAELKRAQPPVAPFERAHAQEMSKVYGSAFRSMALLYQTKGDTAKANTMFAAAMEAARQRFRPILMTSLATVLGALPIALALGASAKSRVSMGIAIIGGLLFSLMLTLIIIPLFYTIVSSTKKHTPHEEA